MKTETYLKDLLAQKRIGRRDFIRNAVAAGVAASAAMTIYDKALAATPAKGGHFRQALTGGGTSDVLDPAQTLDAFMINVSFGQ